MSGSLKVGVLGGSGNAGSQLVKHSSSKGVEVIAVARNSAKIPQLPRVTPDAGDAKNVEDVGEKLKGIDVLASALFFDVSVDEILKIAEISGAKRIVVVGGAGSLEASEGGPLLVDTPQFPDEFKEIARQGVKFLDDWRKVTDVDWVLVSPPIIISNDVPATGKYRTGKDVLLTDEKGNSQISYDDFSLAVADEIIDQQHSKGRFTVIEDK